MRDWLRRVGKDEYVDSHVDCTGCHHHSATYVSKRDLRNRPLAARDWNRRVPTKPTVRKEDA
jgi:hypothetical protein